MGLERLPLLQLITLIGMEKKNKQLTSHATSAGVPVKSMAPKDFKNLPIHNTIGVDPEILMRALRSKNTWSDPDPYNLNSPEACAKICHGWSNEYLISTDNL